MATDITVALEDRPGTLAALGTALGAAGVNIDGLAGIQCGDEGLIHILVEDAAAARGALDGVGIEVRDSREVLVLEVEDRPGALATVARRISDAGVNVELTYLAAGTRLVIGADDLEKARAATT